MRQALAIGWAALLAVSLVAIGSPTLAAPTPAQKKELSDISSDLRKVPSLISRKKIEDAEKELADVESRLDKLVKDAQIPDADPQVKGLRRQLEIQRTALERASGGKPGGGAAVSFSKDVAPILAAKCVSCHDGNRPSGNLRLENFAGMEAGGRSGALLAPGNPNASLILARIASPDPARRMPKDADALAPKEIQTIAAWIAAGAQYDGTEKNVALATLAKNPAAANEKIEIAKATGNEKVSFIRDVAPTFVQTCGGCHGMNNPRGGLSLATFEKVMAGGESGRVIIPGNVEDSRLFQLVADGSMPRGNMTAITRKWYADLQTWIKEGAKYDGTDPRRPLRELIPTPEQLKAEQLAKLSPADWIAKRQQDVKDLWTQTFPQGAEPRVVEGPDFIVGGDVSEDRLKQVLAWAQEQATALRTMFNVKEEPLWKGKLVVLVFKDRFGYEEFNSTVYRRDVPREVLGHSDVTTAQERAVAAVQDIGDDAGDSSPGLQLSVAEHVTGAFLKRNGGNLPDWLTRGTGLAIASKSAGPNPYIQGMRGHAGDVLRKSNINDAGEVFANGQFSPGDIGPVGYTLVDFLLKQGGPAAFGQLVRRFQAGDTPDAAIRNAYKADPRQLGAAYAQSLGGATAPAKGKGKK